MRQCNQNFCCGTSSVDFFNENDILKRLHLTKIEDEAELQKLLRPKHRHSLRQILGEENLKETQHLDADSAMDYLDSLSSESAIRAAVAISSSKLTSGDSIEAAKCP